MRVLVLGGNGFIGSHVVDSFLKSGHSVRVFDRSPEKFREPLKGVDYRIAPFDDIPSLTEALEGVDVVIHLISTTVPSTSNKDPEYDIQSNLIGTVKLLNLIPGSGVKKICYLSSGGTVYGIPKQCPIPTSHDLSPICSYGVVKCAIEKYLAMYEYLYGIEKVVLRASNPFGERQGHAGVQGVIGTFMRKIITGDDIVIWGDGGIVRDFIYVKDLSELIVKAAVSGSGVFNAGSGEGRSIKDVVNALTAVTGHPLSPVFKEARNYDVRSVVLDIGETSSQFDWVPEVEFEKGLRNTWSWMREVLG